MHHSRDNSASGFLALTRHDEYYLIGGDLFFMVEHNHFRVHRYFFERESAFFRGKLTTPASPGATRQGSSESNAILLDGVRAADFAKFLWVFYNPRYSLYRATPEDWTVILSLAHKWSFPEVKNLAVRELEKLEMPDLDRVVVYHENDVDRNLLVPRYAALCEREQPLTLPEGMRLGMETTLMIARTREYARANPMQNGARSPSVSNVHGNELHSIVRELFGVPAITDPVDEAPSASPGILSSSPLKGPTSKPPQRQQAPPPPPSQTAKQQTAQTPRQPPPSPPQTPPSTGPQEIQNQTAVPKPKQGKKGKQTATTQKSTSQLEVKKTELPPLPPSQQILPTSCPPQPEEEAEAEANGAEFSASVMDQNGSEVSDGAKFTQAVVDGVLDFGVSCADVQKDGNASISQSEQSPKDSSETASPKVDGVEAKDIKIDFENPFSGDGSGDLGLFNSENWSKPLM